MTPQDINRTGLQLAVKELLRENPEFLKGIIRGILAEDQGSTGDEKDSRQKKLEEFIRKDFRTYEKVFKTLA